MLQLFALSLLLVQTPAQTTGASHDLRSGGLESKLHARVANYKIRADGIADAMVKVAGEFNLPIGVEWVRSAPGSTGINLSLTDVTIEQILHSVLDHYPGYDMETKSGVIHVRPDLLVPEGQNFLKVKVQHFEAHNETFTVIGHRLHDLIRAEIAPPKPTPSRGMPSGAAHSYQGEEGEPEVTLELQNVECEAVLDALALASDRKIWVVTFREAGELTPTGYRRTVTLWNNMPIPDNQQPVWDTFRWGQALPSSSPAAAPQPKD